ncbi:MAG: hypothetical protein GY913_24775 [Proteobacteria bacterium]|nr:hypothetical protein [Pseudomonadota bacterium]MCP4920130.1 hypothetical protein [Pseudomonadota bacterium]
MRLRHALIPIALTALACGGGRSADTGEDEPRGGLFGGGGGNDDTQDSFGGDDTDPGGGNGGITRHCPKYSGFMDSGAEWKWAYTAEYEQETGQAYDSTTWVHSVDDVGDAYKVVIKSEGELEHPSYERYESSTSSTYECDDDGAWLVRSDTDLVYQISGQSAQTIEQTVRYTDPLLVMIWDVEDGSSWDASYAYEVTQNGSTTDYEYEATYVVSDHDDVTVPAGTFKNVLKVKAQGQDYYWVVDKDAGTVWSGDVSELKSWHK